MKARQEPVAGPHVREHLELERALEHQAPVPLAGRPRRARKTLVRVALFKVRGVEVHRPAGPERERHRAVRHPRVVVRVDAHLARLVRAVDHPHEALAPERVRGRGEERHVVKTHPRRHRDRPRSACRGRRHARHGKAGMRRHRVARRRGVHRVRHPRVRAGAGHPLLQCDAARERRGRCLVRGGTLEGAGRSDATQTLPRPGFLDGHEKKRRHEHRAREHRAGMPRHRHALPATSRPRRAA